MAEKEQQTGYPLASANGYTRSDQEAGPVSAKELRHKKRMKCLLYVVLFAIFQTGIITLFALTIMKMRTPKFRVRSATFGRFDYDPSNRSFNLMMNAELGVKNTNFGHYKFDNSTINFFYENTQVGTAQILKARARARSTKKFIVAVDLVMPSSNSNELGAALNSGILPLRSQSSLRGKIELFKVMKKKKSTQMNCTMEINLNDRQLQNIMCK